MFNSIIELYNQIPEEYYKYIIYIPYFFIGLIAAILLTPFFGYIASKLNIFDYPATDRSKHNANKYDNAERHIHTTKKPFLGGLAILVPFCILLIVLSNQSPVAMPILVALCIIVVVGVIDDAYNLRASTQLIAQIVAALIVVCSVINLTDITNPLSDGHISLNLAEIKFYVSTVMIDIVLPGDLIAFCWIMVCINAVKWQGGSDGLLEGNIFIALLFIFIMAVKTYSNDVSIYSLFLAGGMLGFLFFNFPPAKIFTGCTGKTAYGLLLAVLAIINGTKIATTIMILTLPLIDAGFVLIKRALKHKPKSLVELLRINDKTHLHHQLLNIGFSPKEVLLTEAVITLIISSVAVLIAGTVKYFLLLIVCAITFVAILLLHKRNSKKTEDENPPSADTPESKYSY